MSSRSKRLGGAVLLALAGCGHVTAEDELGPPDESPTTDDSSPPGDPGPRFRFFLSEAGGAARTDFVSVTDAYLNAAGTATLVPGDYYVSIWYEVCPPGMPSDIYFPHQSSIGCRTFRVGTSGTIATASSAINGVACPHAIGSDVASGGATIGLMPFELLPTACGTFIARVIPAGAPEHPLQAVANLYFTAPVPSEPEIDPPDCEAGAP